MTNTNQLIFLQEFTASQQVSLFRQLKQNYFSGQIQINAQGSEYTFYLYLGRIIYATGGVHKVRRWKRHITQYCKNIQLDNESLAKVISIFRQTENIVLPWEYHVLDAWIKEEKITREELLGLTRSLVSEVLWDLSQIGSISYLVKPDTVYLDPPVVIDADQVIVRAWKIWQDWQSAKLGDRSPNMSPVIKKPEELKLQISPETYEMMRQNITGEYSLRELSLKFNRNLISLTKALMVYIQLGLIELQEIPDLFSLESDSIKLPTSLTIPSNRFLIGCVDDSVMITRTLGKIVQDAGHDFLACNDSLQAFAMFMARKPNLIFLDLIMPATNGYELCAGLRKLAVFRQTPIILLTQNNNILDRMKGKMSGVNDFLSKPINRQEVLNIIGKYLLII